MFTCDLYAGSPPPHHLERLRTTMQRRVVDFVRVGYFIPPNGPLNGHPPSILAIESSRLVRPVHFQNVQTSPSLCLLLLFNHPLLDVWPIEKYDANVTWLPSRNKAFTYILT